MPAAATATTPVRRRTAAPAADPSRRPTLRVVPRRRHRGRYVVAMLVIGAVGVFGIVSLSALAAEAAFAARALEQEIDELAFRYDELTAEVASLESPARVRAVAQEQLGMVPAEQPAFLIVDGSAVGGGPAPGVGPEAVLSESSGTVTDPVKHALGAGN
jgi:cell division protein FtsL